VQYTDDIIDLSKHCFFDPDWLNDAAEGEEIRKAMWVFKSSSSSSQSSTASSSSATSSSFVPNPPKAVKAGKSTNVAIILPSKQILEDVVLILSNLPDESFTSHSINAKVKELTVSKSISFKDVFVPLRFALSASLRGPSLTELVAVLGKKRSIDRINNCIHAMESL
jgi:glutamyl/glutaminyl-tRNA synthetase